MILDILGYQDSELEYIQLSSVVWKLAKYGESECLLEKTSKNSDNSDNSDIWVSGSKVFVRLKPNDTENLYGLYTHQITLTDINSNVFVINQGNIYIDMRII